MSAEAFLKKYSETDKKANVFMKGFPLNRPLATGVNGDVGLELEIEAGALPNEGDLATIITPKSKVRWAAKADGSLRGEAVEYVLTGPAYIDEVPLLLGGLWDKFRQRGTQFRLSNRCSTHVHVNMSGKKVNHLTSIIALWTTLEEALINWCGEERKSNHFCLTAKDSIPLIQKWQEFLRTGRMDYPEGFKYSALNVRTLRQIGSFEFRPMRASTEPEPLLDWTRFIHGLTKYATEKYANPQVLASDLSELGGIELFTLIAREAGCSALFIDQVLSHPDNRDFHGMAMEGFRIAQPLVLGHPWHEYMDQINREYVPDPFGKAGSSFFDGDIERTIRAAGDALAREEARFRPRGGRLDPWNAEPAPAAGAAGLRAEPIAAHPPTNRHRAYRIDPNQPIEFIDGTPATGEPSGEGTMRVRAIIPILAADHQTRLDTPWSYDLSTGFYSGDHTVAQIRNVGAEWRAI